MSPPGRPKGESLSAQREGSLVNCAVPAPLRIDEQVSLRGFNTFGVESRARWFCRITDATQLVALADESHLAGVPRLVLGGGSNLLFTRDFDGLVLKLDLPGLRELPADEQHWRIEAGAGENWHATVARTLAMERPGLENLALIPGQVGAAPIQNIGAYGLELAERFESLTLWDFETNSTRCLNLVDCDFGYRDSVFKRALAGRCAILNVVFALPRRWQPIAGYADVANELRARFAVASCRTPLRSATPAASSRILWSAASIATI
jgi:UDP-N-acetylmuramate dehydrogenase